jgi:hypothetical protein
LLLVAVLAAGVAARLSSQDDPPVQVPAVDPHAMSEPLGHAPPSPRW